MGCGSLTAKADHAHDPRVAPRPQKVALPAGLAAASNGRFRSNLPKGDEGPRDFARIFFAKERKIFLFAKGMQGMRPLQPTSSPCSLNVGDLSEHVFDRADALFTESLAAHLAQVCSTAPDPILVEKLCSRAAAAMTVNVGLDLVLHLKLMPTFLQPLFLIIVLGELAEARAITYGFVAGHQHHILGDRPDSKHTPFCVRLLSPNLLVSSEEEEELETCWEVDYRIRNVQTSTIRQVVDMEIDLVREAIRLNSWDPLL